MSPQKHVVYGLLIVLIGVLTGGLYLGDMWRETTSVDAMLTNGQQGVATVVGKRRTRRSCGVRTCVDNQLELEFLDRNDVLTRRWFKVQRSYSVWDSYAPGDPVGVTWSADADRVIAPELMEQLASPMFPFYGLVFLVMVMILSGGILIYRGLNSSREPS